MRQSDQSHQVLPQTTTSNTNTFVNGYGNFLHQNWGSYNYEPSSFFNDNNGLYGISNHLSVLECVGTLNFLIDELSYNYQSNEDPEILNQINTLNNQLDQFHCTMSNIEQMNKIHDVFEESQYHFSSPKETVNIDQDLPAVPSIHHWHHHHHSHKLG